MGGGDGDFDLPLDPVGTLLGVGDIDGKVVPFHPGIWLGVTLAGEIFVDVDGSSPWLVTGRTSACGGLNEMCVS